MKQRNWKHAYGQRVAFKHDMHRISPLAVHLLGLLSNIIYTGWPMV